MLYSNRRDSKSIIRLNIGLNIGILSTDIDSEVIVGKGRDALLARVVVCVLLV